MKNKQARKMIELVSGANFIFDVAPRGFSTSGGALWVSNTERVNKKVSLTADQLKEVK